LFYGVFVRFSTRGVQKYHKNVLVFGENPSQKLLAEKVEKKKMLSSFPINFFLSRFFAVFLHEEPKNTTKIFSKTRGLPKKRKRKQARKKQSGEK
jgi:hypothetical protein